jgi:Rrf2 family iron-sulfur cluster assembly transcriptional regulator
MAMADMAAMGGSLSPISLQDISLRQNLSLNYLEQIFVKLRRNNLVKSFRGPGGGYVLISTPEEVSVFDIVSAVGESTKMAKCSVEKASCNNSAGKCITHFLWDGMDKHVTSYLQGVKLADIASMSVRGKQNA